MTMKNLLMGTTNPAKIAQIRDALAPLGIHVEGVADKAKLPHVEEDGATVQENARKKAAVYAQTFRKRVFSMDNALFFEGLAPEDQPGIHVRRIGGKDAATDEELFQHGLALVTSLGERVSGYWEYAACVADPNGQVWETTIRTPRIFTNRPSPKRIEGYPLESIQIDPETGMYISEMSLEERAAFWQRTLGAELRDFIQTIR